MSGQTGSLVAGRYLLGDLLGRGGMADVFRANDERLGRPVALKLLRVQAASATDRERFAAEAHTLARLDHPGVVTLLDAGLEDDQPWLAMQLVEGATLASRFTGGSLVPADVAEIGRQVAEGLAYAHACGVVHRDVKPGNILLAPDGRALIADFGIAHLLDGTTRHTAVGQAIGSPAYLAPEQASGGELSGATDVYSLGLLLLEALTGERRFRGTTTEMVYARLQAPPEVPAELPLGWGTLLRAMTSVAPGDRPNADEVATTLAGFDGEDLAAADPEATAPFAAPFAVAEVPVAGRTVEPDGTRVFAGVPAAGDATARPRVHRRAPSFLAAAAVVAVLVLLSGLWLALRDPAPPASSVPPVPSGVPSQLESPLADLHDAIHGGAE
ncbi:serine/threonine-protein kinase [Nocardioides sp.]|uniref:serine/threonine-protein kinase n=1 Tax=Nocardioides sp. TaxID=35761 RepID=UPI002C3F0779|nr:serine/threonine-protein kinase [Nocardioides sp.]HSX68038.1 serine/threonine-protein kinase [Nocardioides sp.]